MVFNGTVQAAMSDRGLLNWFANTYSLNHFFVSSTLGTSSYSLAFNEGDTLRDYLVRPRSAPVA